jgi:hypothetical protein
MIPGYDPSHWLGSYPGVKSSFKLIILSTHESKHSEQNFPGKILIRKKNDAFSLADIAYGYDPTYDQ